MDARELTKVDEVIEKIKRDIFDACSDYYHMPVYKLTCDEIFEIVDKNWKGDERK